MPIMFNTLLHAVGIELGDVRLLRHKDNKSARGRTPYELWRDDHPKFELYQSIQYPANVDKLRSPIWASFVGTLNDETLFVGLYRTINSRLLTQDSLKPHTDGVDKAGTCYVFDLILDDRLAELAGRLVIDWGLAARSWIQRADKQDKVVLELREGFKEPEFAGFLEFMEPFSRLAKLPKSWEVALRSTKGVYLLTCPRTKEQYVGSATGEDGFWGRWHDYIQTGHGGDIALKSRDMSDYQVSILEVAGTAATIGDILTMEERWKSKLQSREMGLNRN